jgi:hypothetical protein
MKRYLVVILAVLAACSGNTSGAAPKPRTDRSVLTLEEITKAGAQDAFTAVQALRPHWLSTRGTNSVRMPATVKVYLDGNLMGGVEFLRQITVSSISSIRHMDALEATQRYGLDHGAGAILMFTRTADSLTR